jgi:hypothetical protein
VLGGRAHDQGHAARSQGVVYRPRCRDRVLRPTDDVGGDDDVRRTSSSATSRSRRPHGRSAYSSPDL